MNLFKHLGIKCILMTVILLTNFYIGSYIIKPFTYVDLIAILFFICFVIISFNFYDRVKKCLKPISLTKDLLLLVAAFFIAIIFTGILTEGLQVLFLSTLSKQV